MRQGDFTTLAKQYGNRTGYSELVLENIVNQIKVSHNLSQVKMADVGAGTGKLTKQLLEMGLDVTAVEPNDAMQEEGKIYTKQHKLEWLKGSGEETNLANETYDWLTMASSFHWTDPEKSLVEFYRVLKPNGYLTVLWNPRDLENSELHHRIEQRIFRIAPHINRVSSGSSKYTQNIEETMVSTGHFKSVIFMEARHVVTMNKERYMGAWRSVNDIQAQAGEAVWNEILEAIEAEISDQVEIIVPYKTRAWTCRKVS